MTIRIDGIRRFERSDGAYAWQITIKGLKGKGVYFTAITGINGEGLFVDSGGGQQVFADPSREIDHCFQVILPADRFTVHPSCDAREVVDRVAAALVAIGWGPEDYDDRDSISGDRWPYRSIS